MNQTFDREQLERPLPTETTEPADIDTRALFAGRTEIRIAHNDAVYRLKITRSGKLILNK